MGPHESPAIVAVNFIGNYLTHRSVSDANPAYWDFDLVELEGYLVSRRDAGDKLFRLIRGLDDADSETRIYATLVSKGEHVLADFNGHDQAYIRRYLEQRDALVTNPEHWTFDLFEIAIYLTDGNVAGYPTIRIARGLTSANVETPVLTWVDGDGHSVIDKDANAKAMQASRPSPPLW